MQLKAIFIGLSVISAPAFGADLYDIKKRCRDSAELLNTGPTLELACRQTEENAKAMLDKMTNVPRNIISSCRVGADLAASYILLKACIDMEMRSLEQLRRR